MTRNLWSVLLTLICLWVCPLRINGFSWNIFSSSSSSSGSSATANQRAPMMELEGLVADFAMDGANDPRGLKMLENSRNKVAEPRNCWQEACRRLFASCGEIMADKEKQSHLAWHLSSCHQEDSGRLSDSEGKVFLEFFLETNTLCHQLQAEAFKHNTEGLVNDLTRTSKSAEEKLEVIEERSDHIIKESSKVQDTLSTTEIQTNNLTEASKNIDVNVIFERSKEIAAAQIALKEGQKEMREKIDAGMARVQESYKSLGDGMDTLKEETGYIFFLTGKSLENQRQILDGQDRAREGLDTTDFRHKLLKKPGK